MRVIRDKHGGELRVARSADGHLLTVQATLSTRRSLDRRGVRALLDIIASSSEFRREMHNALAVYDGGPPGGPVGRVRRGRSVPRALEG
jgi:hypothetical protein